MMEFKSLLAQTAEQNRDQRSAGRFGESMREYH
jgi:hypothetical protein